MFRVKASWELSVARRHARFIMLTTVAFHHHLGFKVLSHVGVCASFGRFLPSENNSRLFPGMTVSADWKGASQDVRSESQAWVFEESEGAGLHFERDRSVAASIVP